MRSDINNAVFFIIMRQIVAVFTAVKSKLQNLHTRKTAFFKKIDHILINITEILCNDIGFAERSFNRFEKLNAGAFKPDTVNCVFHSVLDGVI